MQFQHSISALLGLLLISGTGAIAVAQATGHILTSVQGAVSLKRGATTTALSGNPNLALQQGDNIITGSGARAFVKCASNQSWQMPAQSTWIVGSACPPRRNQPGDPFR